MGSLKAEDQPKFCGLLNRQAEELPHPWEAGLTPIWRSALPRPPVGAWPAKGYRQGWSLSGAVTTRSRWAANAVGEPRRRSP
jgi:hypothetical protein